MRYYSSEYRRWLKKSVKDVSDSVESHGYKQNIECVQAFTHNQSNCKLQCRSAAEYAQTQMSIVKTKFDVLSSMLDNFYNDANSVSSSVSSSAKKINEIITEANASLIRINDALKGVGQYQGEALSQENLQSAGIDKAKCDTLKKDTWKKILVTEKSYKCIHDIIAHDFVERVIGDYNNGKELSNDDADFMDAMSAQFLKSLKWNNIADRVKDTRLLSDLFNHYKDHRLGPTGKTHDLPAETLEVVADIYETINPKAKLITDNFLQPCYEITNKNAENAIHNAMLIKHDLYTADPRLRDLILTCLPNMTLKNQPLNKIACCGGNTLYLHLEESPLNSNDRCAAFFHEFGHAMDNAALEDFELDSRKIDCLSDGYYDTLISDAIGSLQQTIKDLGYEDMETELIEFIISPENVNVATDSNSDYYTTLLPKDWSPEMKKAFKEIRDHYGYYEYTYQSKGGFSYTSKQIEGKICDRSLETSIINDILGGITNNQIAAVGYAHRPNAKYPYLQNGLPTNREDIKGPEDLHKGLTEGSYWALLNKDKPWLTSDIFCTEFFAESFDDRIYGIDQTKNREVFPNGIDMFENDLDMLIEHADELFSN